MKPEQISATALVIAKAIEFIASSEKYRDFVPHEAAKLSLEFIEAHDGSKRFSKRLNNPLYRLLCKCSERLSVPGIFLHYALRKKTIEGIVREKIKDGTHQVIILAAGLDTLAWRLHTEHPDVTFIELDHPATQKIKKKALQKMNESTKNLHLLPIDFDSTPLTSVLLKNGCFKSQLKSLFIAEGITMYLPQDKIEDLLSSIKSVVQSHSSFIFTYMEKQPNGNIQFHNATFLVDLWLKLKNESFKWGIETENLKKLLNNHGFNCDQIFSAADLKRRYLNSEPMKHCILAEGENICHAVIR